MNPESEISTAPIARDDAPVRRSGGGAVALVIAVLAIALGAIALWRICVLERSQAASAAATQSALSDRLDQVAREADQAKRDGEGLRARLTDADGVNKSLREELLGLGERSRHLEDAVANLADQRLSGRDALALGEAEFLLQLAQERLALFQDAPAAISAYRLADSALAASEDPVFASVRQTVGVELKALEAARPLETQATLNSLERLRGDLATLPARASEQVALADESSLGRVLGSFVRVRHDAGTLTSSRDREVAGALVALDLRAAEASLLARDPRSFVAALARAKAGLAAAYDPNAQAVKDSIATLDRLQQAPLAPALPELGSALKELRNLRATRALSRENMLRAPAAGTQQ